MLRRLRCNLAFARHDLDVWLDKRAMIVAGHLPRRLRVWAVVNATNEARQLYPDPMGYAGPDGLSYQEIYDGAQGKKARC